MFCAVLCLVGCKPAATGPENSGPYAKIVDEGQLIQNFEATPVTKEVDIESNVYLSVTSADAWCDAKIFRRDKIQTIHITPTTNTDLASRKGALVTVTGEGVDPIVITVNQLGEAPDILVNHTKIEMDQYGGYATLEITTNIETALVKPEWVVEAPVASKTMVKTSTRYKLGMLNADEDNRTGEIVISASGVHEGLVAAVTVPVILQRSGAPVPIPPPSGGDFPDIVKLKLTNPVLAEGRYNIANAAQGAGAPIDGNKAGSGNSIFHSPFAAAIGTDNPPLAAGEIVALEYEFEDKNSNVNFVVLTTRTGNNGNFEKGKILFKTAASPDAWVEATVIDRPKPTPETDYRYDFQDPIKQPTHIRLEMEAIISPTASEAANGVHYVCLAEMEVFQDASIGALDKYLNTFTDVSISQLKDGMSMAEIREIDNPTIRGIGMQLYEGTYPSKFRIHNVEPLRPVADLAKELMTSSYNQFENPTGIFYKKDMEAIVFVGPTNGEKVSINVVDFNTDKQPRSSYALAEGINKVKITGDGNVYISYFTPDYATAKPITVHLVNGDVTGYFDVERDNNSDWVTMLQNAVSPIMDIKGKYVNAAFQVEKFRKFCPSNGLELAQLYDKIVWEEWQMMGLVKHNRVPKNNMFMYVSTDASTAAAGGMGAMFPPAWGEGAGTEVLTSIKNMTESSWVIGHELGHVNQTRRGFKFAGMDEVTNNVLASWVQYALDKDTRRLENMDRRLFATNNGAATPHYTMSPFNMMLNNSMIRGDLWIHTEGQLRKETIVPGTVPSTDGGDFFARMIPYYQYWMYFGVAKGLEGGYAFADVFEKVRTESGTLNQSNNGDDTPHYVNMLIWMAQVANADLTPYYTKFRMLEPRHYAYGSYGSAPILNITQTDIDKIKAACGALPKLDVALEYINQNNYALFQTKPAVIGTLGQGVSNYADPNGATGAKVIDHAVWKNAVGFEVFQGGKMVYAAISGTGNTAAKDANKTVVLYPTGATAIKAVAADGTRTICFGAAGGNSAGGFEPGTL